jgi:two-component system cell cycle sensor histidine kinase PleC
MPFEPPKILIVDDRQANLLALKTLLAKVEATVITADSGNQALARTLDHDFALMLLDVQMPDMSGYDVAELLRGEERTRRVPIIFVTAAYKDDTHRILAYGAGAVDYIEKPIDEAILLSKVRVFLELDRARRDLSRAAEQLAAQNRRLEAEVAGHQATLAALRDSEERFRLAVSGTNDGIWDYDLITGRCTYSPRWKQMLGWQDAEVSDSRDEWCRRVHPDDLEKALTDIELHLAAKTPIYENVHRLQHRDGFYRWVLDRGRAVRSARGRPVRMVGATTDITEQRRHQVRIQHLNDRLEQILRSVAEGIFGIDTGGRITFANTAMERLSGRPRSELIGRSAAELVLHCGNGPDESTIGEGLIWAACHKSEAQTVRNDLLRRPDGTTLPVDYTAAPLMTGDIVTGAVVVVRDATERLKFEVGLEQARIAAEETSRAKSAFLAIMSHELRTPLNTILGFSEIIRDAAFGPAAERYREYAGDIFNSGAHLLDLINDILDLSKIEAGRMEIEPQWQELRFTLASVVRLIREKATRQTVDITIALDPDLPLLYADERAFKQIMLNVLSNALKFTPSGGRITIHAAARPDGGIALSVSDTGPGIAPERLDRLFIPFEQIDNRYNREAAGTGLGLSLTKGLVDIHGGSLVIESTLGTGTVVTVILPPGPGGPRPHGQSPDSEDSLQVDLRL